MGQKKIGQMYANKKENDHKAHPEEVITDLS